MPIRKRNGPLPDNHPYKGVQVASADSPLVVGLKKAKERERRKASQNHPSTNPEVSDPADQSSGIETEADWVSGKLSGHRVAKMQHQNRSMRHPEKPEEAGEQPSDSGEPPQ